MDKQQRHMAIELHAEAHAQFGAHYAKLKEIFNAELELNESTSSDLRGEQDDGSLNHEMIDTFIRALPPSTRQKYLHPLHRTEAERLIIGSSDLSTALAQRSSMVFFTSHQYTGVTNPTPEPCYIIGARYDTNELLLARPQRPMMDMSDIGRTGSEDRFMILSPFYPEKKLGMNRRRDRAIIQARFDAVVAGIDGTAALAMSGSNTFARSVFDASKTGMYEITADSEGSKTIRAIALDEPRYAVPDYVQEPITYISNTDFAQFNVHYHLSLLAGMFNKKDEFIKAFTPESDHTAIPPKKIQRAMTFAATKVQAPFKT